MVKCLCSATVISYISSVALTASCGRAADEGDDGRRRGHGEAADAGRLGDRAVADVGVGVGGSRSRGSRGRRAPAAGAVNQRSPRPLTRMPKSVPLRAMVVTIVLPSTPCAASAMALHAAITGLRTLSGVVAEEAQHLGGASGVGARCGQSCGASALQEEERAGLVAVVALVAHVQRLGEQRAQVDAARSARAPRRATGASTSFIQRRRSSTSVAKAP